MVGDNAYDKLDRRFGINHGANKIMRGVNSSGGNLRQVTM